ncbi:siderophore-interacting protein [Rhodococcus aerolatus]
MGMHRARVARVQRLSRHLARITLTGPSLAGFVDDGPDQRAKLLLPRPGRGLPPLDGSARWYEAWQATAPEERPVLRTYTVRRSRPHDAEVDLDVVLHGDSGPGSAWACRAAPGDEVALYGPYAEHECPPDAAWQLVVADHTALPAAAAILEQATPGPLVALVEVPGADDELDLVVPPGARLTWLHTGTGEPGRALRAAVAATTLPGGPGYAWVCADTTTVQHVRRDLVTGRGMPADRVMFMGYWRTDGPIDPA